MQAVLQNRPGVPQFQMPHGLLLQGLRCLKHIFPGFEEELLAAGGISVDWGEECDFRDFGVRRAWNNCCPAGSLNDKPMLHVF